MDTAKMKHAAKTAFSLLMLLFPLLCFFMLKHLGLMLTAGITLITCGLHLLTQRWTGRKMDAMGMIPVQVFMLMAALAAMLQKEELLLLQPAVMNATLLLLFYLSLYFPPTVVERIARVSEPNLDARGVRYCRKVTWVWIFFFSINGAIAAATALAGSEYKHLWAWYNGCIAYILIGMLMGAEYLVRRRMKARHAAEDAAERARRQAG